jgi:hypothetical protein
MSVWALDRVKALEKSHFGARPSIFLIFITAIRKVDRQYCLRAKTVGTNHGFSHGWFRKETWETRGGQVDRQAAKDDEGSEISCAGEIVTRSIRRFAIGGARITQ